MAITSREMSGDDDLVLKKVGMFDDVVQVHMTLGGRLCWADAIV